VPRLFAAGEAVGGANGANRLSGNAIPEALVFGRVAGLSAAQLSVVERAHPWRDEAAHEVVDLLSSETTRTTANPARLLVRLQKLMSERAGPIRHEEGLASAWQEILALKQAMGTVLPTARQGFDTARLDWFDLRNMLLVAETVTRAALARRESRGAHQREDFPQTDPDWAFNQTMRLESDALTLDRILAHRNEARSAAQ
jgi:succinate dehydrogenase/fumarate reductase flavoprotein subunit